MISKRSFSLVLMLAQESDLRKKLTLFLTRMNICSFDQSNNRVILLTNEVIYVDNLFLRNF